jgi:hypothetical protein
LTFEVDRLQVNDLETLDSEKEPLLDEKNSKKLTIE